MWWDVILHSGWGKVSSFILVYIKPSGLWPSVKRFFVFFFEVARSFALGLGEFDNFESISRENKGYVHNSKEILEGNNVHEEDLKGRKYWKKRKCIRGKLDRVKIQCYDKCGLIKSQRVDGEAIVGNFVGNFVKGETLKSWIEEVWKLILVYCLVFHFLVHH